MPAGGSVAYQMACEPEDSDMSEEEIRLQCLALAESRAARSGLNSFDVANCAREYFDFVRGHKGYNSTDTEVFWREQPRARGVETEAVMRGSQPGRDGGPLPNTKYGY